MTRRSVLSALAGASAAFGADPIVKHPSELKFTPRVYTPPRGAGFQHKLACGATAFLVEDPTFPLINLSLIVRTGDYLEPRDKAGLAGLTGVQMRSGGTQSKKPSVFDEEAAFLAATIGSGIGDVSGSASLNCLSKDIDAGLALLVEMLRTPGFAEDRLRLAKSQILQQMERRNDSTASIENREWDRLLRGDDHFSTWDSTKASIESITRQDLIDFHGKYFYPANFVFAVSGDFKTREMLERLDKTFGNWPNLTAPIPEVPAPKFTPKPGVYLVNKSGVNQGRVRIGHLGVTISNPDHLAISLMNAILGGGAFTSRITERVRSDEGLAYQAASIFQAGTYYPGTFSALFQSKSQTVAQAVDIVLEEIEKMRSAKVKPEELETAKAR
ncbi:MAG: M16 family metallopeptidase, partial [Bryobacteraceae bacterium]